ncbi:unnamed protein product [Rotaria sp. Silwood2]|nr:unnamed protein product [Rotaria sp. Silwood2]
MSHPCTTTVSEGAPISTTHDSCNRTICQDPSKEHDDLPNLSPPYRTVNRSGGSSRLLASNDRFVLICQFPHLSLIDQDLTVINQSLWAYGWLCDICWSSALAGFIATTHNDVFLLDESTLSCERLDAIVEQGWFSCTCSDTSLFLSSFGRGASVSEFTLLPSIQLVKQWLSPDTCGEDELINDIVYKNGACALMVNNPLNKTIRMELRSSTTFNRLWSLQLDIASSKNAITCCSLNNTDEWLVIDCDTSRLFHITNEGKVKATREYNPKPWRACYFGPKFLVIATMGGVNVHKL